MVNVKIGDELRKTKIKSIVRFDFKGERKPGKLFLGGKPMQQVAEEHREQQVTLLRSLPIRGIVIEDCDMSMAPYITNDDLLKERVAFAPAMLTMVSDSIEDMIKFVTREEFRKLEILEPSHMTISGYDLERILFCVCEELKRQMMLFSKNIRR